MAGVDSLDARFPTSQGVPTSDIVKAYLGLLYQKVDGYTPIAAYLGNEGWCLGLALRPGKQHTMKEKAGGPAWTPPRSP